MGKAKEIIIKVIPSNAANDFVKKYHYSGKVVNNSILHFGAFLDGVLHGVLSFGSPLDKRKVLPLVVDSAGKPCLWNEMLELNRMAFDDVLPKNSESRCISIAIKLIKKNAPHIKWILSFADGTQCGDGAIYRASGFILSGIKKNGQIMRLSNGSIISRKTLDDFHGENGRYGSSIARENGAIFVDGFQLRYIYIIDKTCRLNCEQFPFSKIMEMGAGMYKGEKRAGSIVSDAPSDQGGEGGAVPTPALQIKHHAD